MSDDERRDIYVTIQGVLRDATDEECDQLLDDIAGLGLTIIRCEAD
jgi:hypothetical protein